MTERSSSEPGGGRRTLGLIVNPIAGMGGRVGLKGTDGVVERAIGLGAEPGAGERAIEMLGELKQLLAVASPPMSIRWLTGAGSMGADCLSSTCFDDVSIVHRPGPATTAADTRAVAQALIDAEGELIVFCGGDGTARDICGVTGASTPILGIPAGVKMYSGVFGVTPIRTAQVLVGFLRGDLELAEVEVLDIDEERYRRGEWSVRLHATACTPFEPSLTQAAKSRLTGAGEREVAADIADDIGERLAADPETLVLLGPGSTVEAVGRRLGVETTVLGVDAVLGGERIGADLDERRLLELLDTDQRCVLVLSPIGAQGFVLGRGNQQLSPEVVRRVGAGNVLVIATPAKLARTPVLRFDTGDRALDAVFADTGYLEVVVGYRRSRLVPVEV